MLPIIKIENLSKQYRLGKIGTGTITRDLNRWWYTIRGKEDPYLRIGETNDRSTKGNSEFVWALKNINLEVKPGEVLGIIGKNGAGKSTLLKILSKVTGPTTGKIYFNGRVGCLLEVGTGFHQELTGIENIYLNGAILGMTKAEIKRKLDEIVDFSGCERYIDTPVKRYSSGMIVRLGFAVAAHLDPEILVVDEVLAVGDAEFQKKAIGKMQDISHKEGRTVLFVSHNMGSIENLCNKAILLDKGHLVNEGEVNEVIRSYLQMGVSDTNGKFYRNEKPARHSRQGWIKEITIKDTNNNECQQFKIGDEILIEVKFILDEKFSTSVVGIVLQNERGIELAAPNSWQQMGPIEGKEGENTVICQYKTPILLPGRYFIRVDLGNYYNSLDTVNGEVSFQVESSDFFGTGRIANPNLLVVSQAEWTII